MADPSQLKAEILRLAGEQGFVRAGIAPAGVLTHQGLFDQFLALGLHAEMAWLQRHRDVRADVRRLMPEARSVICLAASYAPGPEDAGDALVARYARGRDYHRVLERRCRRIAAGLELLAGPFRRRICVDAQPLAERELAARAGLGWIGRSGCLIGGRHGSWLLLAEIVTELPLEPDEPAKSRCGRCRSCVEACPTGAIRGDGLVDCRRCISYLTVEHRGPIGPELAGRMGIRVVGCDACQAACPWNRKAPPGEAELRGPSPLTGAALADLLAASGEQWEALTRGSAGRRVRYEMLLRNAAIAAGNAGDAAHRPALERLARHESPMVAQAAGWALSQR